MTPEELRDIYIKSVKARVAHAIDRDEQIANRTVARIRRLLEKKARQGESEVRFVTGSMLPEVAESFREEGFIVWRNSEVTIIKIPL